MTVWDTILVMKIKRRIVFKMKMERKNSFKIHYPLSTNNQPPLLLIFLYLIIHSHHWMLLVRNRIYWAIQIPSHQYVFVNHIVWLLLPQKIVLLLFGI